MPDSISGQLSVGDARWAVVVSRFNEFISRRLQEGAVETLQRLGSSEDRITCVHVPGSMELAMVARKLAESGRFAAIICLGCIIRGETPHFDLVAAESARGIAQVATSSGIPTVFGVITADNLQQAVDRAGGKNGNKGADAALAAVEMADLMRRLPSRS